MGRYEEALASCEQALKFQPDFFPAWGTLGDALSALGRHEEAIASFEQALKLKPEYYNAWQSRGVALYFLGRYEEALASYEQALKLKPDDSQSWNGRGNALSALGRHEEAIASFEQALKLQPDFSYPWSNRGIAASSSSQYNPSYQKQFTQRFSFSCAQIPQRLQWGILGATEAQASLQASWQTSKPLLGNTFSQKQVPTALLAVIERPLPPALVQLLQQPPPPALFELVHQPPSPKVLDRIHQDSLHHPSLFNLQLQQRGYTGELASYGAELAWIIHKASKKGRKESLKRSRIKLSSILSVFIVP